MKITAINMRILLSIVVQACFFIQCVDVSAKSVFTPDRLDAGVKPNSKQALVFCLKAGQTHLQKISCAKSTVQYCISMKKPPDWNDLNQSSCEFEEVSLWHEIARDDYAELDRNVAVTSEKKENFRQAQITWKKIEKEVCSVYENFPGSNNHSLNLLADCQIFIAATEAVDVDILIDDLSH